MGCSQSKIENEEAVSRCKDRKAFMKSAVTSRNAFAAAHVSYAMSLKNAGAALTDFSQGEVNTSTPHPVGPTVVSPPPQPPPPISTFPPPPPPVPDMPPPLQRAVSMPEFAVSKPHTKPPTVEDTIDEDDEEEDEAEEEEVGPLRRRGRRDNKGGSVGGRIETSTTTTTNVVGPPPPPEVRETTTPPPPPMPEMHDRSWDYFFSADDMPTGTLSDVDYENTVVYHQRPMRSSGTQGSVTVTASPSIEGVVEEMVMPMMGQGGGGRVLKKGKQVVGPGGSSGGDAKRKNVNLVQIFSDLDDCFLKASQSAHHVSKMLEATRLHYHSNFADNRGNFILLYL